MSPVYHLDPDPEPIRKESIAEPPKVAHPTLDPTNQANPSIASATNAVRHRIRDGLPSLDTNPIPFNMVRLESLSDQIPVVPTPVQTIFLCRFTDIPTQRYMNANAIPGTLVAYVDGSPLPVLPTIDIDQNGNFTLPIAPSIQLLITYGWQYLSDGEIHQFLDESRQWLREFQTIAQIPDGLVPALISYASCRCLAALAATAARLTTVKAGDSEVDWSKLQKQFQAESDAACSKAIAERESFYTQGPEAKDPTAVDVSAPFIDPYTPTH